MLKNVCAINMGQSPDSNSYNDDGDGVPFFQGNADFGERYPITRKWCTAPTKMAAPNDILISVRAPIGAMNYAKESCCIGRGLAALTPDKSKVSSEFIFWLMKCKNQELNSKGTGSTFKAIGRKVLEETLVPNITLEKQTKCSAVLEKVYAVIQARKTELQKLDELVKARFVELFGDPVVNPKSWETAPLSALIINANNGMARRGKDADGSIVLRLVELQNGFIDYSAPNRICLNDTEKKRYELVDNDFLFARVNGNPDYVGRCAVFKSIGEPVFHNDHIIRVHFDETKINGCFTSVLLNSDYGKRQMREQIKTSAGQYTISQDGIGAIMAILPPLELQEQFAAFVEQTDKSKVAVQKALDEAQLLFDSLMQKYFG